MSTKAISLEQAHVAILSEAKKSGVNVEQLCENAKAGLLGNKEYRWVEHPYVVTSIEEIENAYKNIKA